MPAKKKEREKGNSDHRLHDTGKGKQRAKRGGGTQGKGKLGGEQKQGGKKE